MYTSSVVKNLWPLKHSLRRNIESGPAVVRNTRVTAWHSGQSMSL